MKLNGKTGKVQFDENGNRKEINLDILNLQNNSFQRVSTSVVCLTWIILCAK